MEDENKLRLRNALRIISASEEDLFFASNIVEDSSAGDGTEVKDPFDDDAFSLDDPEDIPSQNQTFAKVISTLPSFKAFHLSNRVFFFYG